MVAAAFVSVPLFADTSAAGGDSVEAVVQTVAEAGESVDEAIETVQGIGEELGMGDDAAANAAATTQPAATQPADEQAGGADMQANMAEWMANSMPSEHHAKLDGFVGRWDVTTRHWMAPGMPPQTNTGTSEIKWVLGGRFIQENFASAFQMPGAEPQPFEGMGITGYDNAKGEYVGTWSDTMSTAVAASVGQFDDSTQTLTLNSNFDCPMAGPCDMRMTIAVVGPDEVLVEAFKTPQGKEESKFMEITYNRHVGGM